MFAILVIAPFVLVITTCIYNITFHPLAKFPGPKLAACSPLYYLYYVASGRAPHHYDQLFEQYKSDIVRISPSQLATNDPRALREITARHDVNRGNFGLKIVGFGEKFLGTIDDFAEHRRKRKLLAPAFTNSAVIPQESTILTPIIEKLIDRVEEAKGNPIDVSAYMDFTATDFISALAIGGNFGMLDQLKSHPYYRLVPSVMRFSICAQAIPAVHKFLCLLYEKGLYLPKYVTGVAQYLRPHLDARLAVDDIEDRHDIMSIIMKRNKEVTIESEKMHYKELLGEATTIIAAGSDTVATTLTLIFFNLGRHPDAYRQLTSEIRTRFDSLEDITSIHAAELKYLDAVIHESFRLTPSVPAPQWRRCTTPIKVGDHVIPKHTEIGYARQSVFRNPAVFHKPNEFIPERWIEDMGDNLDACQMFGVGSRMCIGKNIAMVELRVILSKLLWKFDWEPVTTEYDMPDYFVLDRQKPMYMKAKSTGV